jgi:2'-5' RNA ligase
LGIRSFVSVDVDDSKALDALELAQSCLENTGADLKLVERENIHLTMRFLGDVHENLLDEVIDLFSCIVTEKFSMKLIGLGVFPSIRRPRVVWVGITKGAEELNGIFESLEPKLVELGFKREKRGFKPHITIARVRSGRNRDLLVQEVLRGGEETFGEFTICSVKLKKSVLTPRGPIYTTLAESRQRS